MSLEGKVFEQIDVNSNTKKPRKFEYPSQCNRLRAQLLHLPTP